MSNSYQAGSPIFMEKFISVLSYVSCGIIGLIWIIFGAVMGLNMKPFLKYHIYQSIFISILYVLVSYALGLVLYLLGFVPFIKYAVGIITYGFSVGVVFNLSVVNLFVLGVLLYLCVGVVQGKYSYLPWVSEIIVVNVRRG